MSTQPDYTEMIEDAVKAFSEQEDKFRSDSEILAKKILGHRPLKPYIHSVKFRSKDVASVRRKLERKAEACRVDGKAFDITADNIFQKIGDLAGVRVLHLHMRQMTRLHPLLIDFLKEEGYVLAQDAHARTWDPEYTKLLREVGLEPEISSDYYTSVHYDIMQNQHCPRRCEIQVRTLAEEVWGEVSHAIDYPMPSTSVACKEQLYALARIAMGLTRLVDSIMRSHEDHNNKHSG